MPTIITGDKVTLKSITDEDLTVLWELIYGLKDPEWKKWDAPYYPLEPKTLDEYKQRALAGTGYDGIAKLGIWVGDVLIGTVGYYWEHRESNWLEMGISIYRLEFWSHGYGSEALRLWIEHLFETLPLVRVGLTTWSGNTRMIKAAEKLGMLREACLRKCRLWQGEYYDSVRYGLLRKEWEELNRPAD